MSSPTWSAPGVAPIAAAMAAAIAEAWRHPEHGRTNVMREALRRMVGPEVFEKIEFQAYGILQLQLNAPEGFEDVPDWALFRICPGCRTLSRTKHTRPQNGRVKLQVLRDKGWLQQQFEQGRTCNAIAKELGCSAPNVVQWAEVHGLLTPRAARHEEIEATVRRMHGAKEGPGAIARQLGGGVTPERVREVLRRLKLATGKSMVYADREWWRVRLEDQGKTVRQCSREAGIRPHAACYYVNRFGFQAISARNNAKGKPRKYPKLHDAIQLRAVLRENGDNYEATARALGCASSLVSRYARSLLGWERRHENQVPHSDPAWWRSRLDDGLTTWEMAEEAGIEEKSAREKLRTLDLLDRAYGNNTRRERARRSA